MTWSFYHDKLSRLKTVTFFSLESEYFCHIISIPGVLRSFSRTGNSDSTKIVTITALSVTIIYQNNTSQCPKQNQGLKVMASLS